MVLNLSNVTDEKMEKLQIEYNLCGSDEGYYCYDSDMEEMFNDNDIGLGERINIEHEFAYNDDYEPIGFDYGDYLYTQELIQNGVIYYCKVYGVYNGCSVDMGFDLERTVLHWI